MEKNDIMYGLDGQENLNLSIDEVVERVFDDNCKVVGESFEETAGQIDWPIKVLVYKRHQLGESDVKRIAQNVLKNTMESLDEDHGNMDEWTDSTDKMKQSAEAFARIVVAEYIPWACEPTGEVREVTREEARKESYSLPTKQSKGE